MKSFRTTVTESRRVSKIALIAVCLVLLSTFANSQSKRPALEIPIGHQQKINSVAFSSDGKLILTGSADNTFIIWDARTGSEIRKVNAGAPVQQAIFTPDASQIITITGQNDAAYVSVNKLVFKKWDANTGRLIMQLPFTGSTGIMFLPNTGDLLVPDYSEDLSKRQQSDLVNLDILYDTANYARRQRQLDSIDEADEEKNEKKHAGQMEEIMKKMGKLEATDKKSVDEYFNKVLGQFMEKQDFNISITNKVYTLLEPKNFKPVSYLNQKLAKPQIMLYNNIEYLVTGDYSTNPFADNRQSINIWKLQDLITAMKDDKKATPWKRFPVSKLPNHIAVSATKGFLASDTGRAAIQLWQLDKTNPLTLIKPRGESLDNLEFSPDGNILYAYSTTFATRYIEGWNTQTFQQVMSAKPPDYYLSYGTQLSPSGDYFTVQSGFTLIKLNQSGDSTGEFKGHSSHPSYYGFSAGGQQVYVNYNGFPDIDEYYQLSYRAGIEHEAYSNKKILTKTEIDKRVKEKMQLYYGQLSNKYNGYNLQWDLTRGGAAYQQAEVFSPDHPTVSPDKNYILSNGHFESGIRETMPMINKLMNRPTEGVSKETNDKLKKYYDTSGIYYKMMFPDHYNSAETQLINKKTKDTVSLIKIDSLDWIMVLKNGYYMTSKNGAKALSYVSGMQVFPFEQFDIKYNRPDLVLKAIGMANPALIEAYRNAYQKRIKRLEIDTTQFREEFEVPEADFRNKDKIEHDQKTGKLSLTITANDNRTTLNRFNVWVNEVPVFGKNGKNIKDTKSSKLNTTIDITLSQGMNRIETSVMNANGIESYRTPLFVQYNPVQPKPGKIYFIGIGIDRFADTSHNLRYCEKDINDLARKLKEKYGTDMQTDLLFNKDVTIENVRSLKKKLMESNEDDKVIIAYSGHGLLSSKYDYYLSTYNVNFSQPEQNGLPYEELETLVDGIKARKKLMLIDACHSGEVDKEEIQNITAVQAELQGKNVKTDARGIKLPPSQSNKLGMKNTFELMQELFVNVGRGTGTTIISAAAGTQFALERGDLKNGVFTYSILELLKPGKTVSVNELKKHVSSRVSELTKGLQQPTARNETQNYDWVIW